MQPVRELVCKTNAGFWQRGLRQLRESNAWAGSPLGVAFWSHLTLLMSISTPASMEGVKNMLLNKVLQPSRAHPHQAPIVPPSKVQEPTATGQQQALGALKCP